MDCLTLWNPQSRKNEKSSFTSQDAFEASLAEGCVSVKVSCDGYETEAVSLGRSGVVGLVMLVLIPVSSLFNFLCWGLYNYGGVDLEFCVTPASNKAVGAFWMCLCPFRWRCSATVCPEERTLMLLVGPNHVYFPLVSGGARCARLCGRVSQKATIIEVEGFSHGGCASVGLFFVV